MTLSQMVILFLIGMGASIGWDLIWRFYRAWSHAKYGPSDKEFSAAMHVVTMWMIHHQTREMTLTVANAEIYEDPSRT